VLNEDIVAAAQYMDQHGKCIGQCEDAHGQVCMVGALLKVTDGFCNNNWKPELWFRYQVARKILESYALKTYGIAMEIPHVNDAILDTKEETVKFMMEAAEYE